MHELRRGAPIIHFIRGVFTIICVDVMAESFPAGRRRTVETVFIKTPVLQTTFPIRDVEGFVMSCRPIRVFYGNWFAAPNGVNTMSNLLISRLDPHRTFAVKRVEADISVLKQYLLDVVP